jgi:hypothetical protein
LRDVAPGADGGWLDLARSERSGDSSESAALADAALEIALATGDADLELRALAQLGLAEVGLGRVDRGLGRLDEAMAAAMSGEAATLETFADFWMAPGRILAGWHLLDGSCDAPRHQGSGRPVGGHIRGGTRPWKATPAGTTMPEWSLHPGLGNADQ